MQGQGSLHNKSRKLMRRYIIRCVVCRKPARKAYEGAIYCSDKCKQVAYRRRVAEREAAELAEMQRRHREAQARAEREAEQKRQAQAAEAERLRQERVNAERWKSEAERRAREQEQRDREWGERQALLNKLIPTCPKCGHREWLIERAKPLLGGDKLVMKCGSCGRSKVEPPTVNPGRCSRCGSEHYTLFADGKLRCETCRVLGREVVRSWEEWTQPRDKPRHWTPRQD